MSKVIGKFLCMLLGSALMVTAGLAQGQSILHEAVPDPVGVAELDELSSRAVLGDSESAWRLFQYYAFEVRDSKKSWYWEQIAAENGDARAQWGLWIKSRSAPDAIAKLRGEFWLRRSASSGYIRAVAELKRIAGES